MQLEALKYPIGPFEQPTPFNPDTLRALITAIERFPEKLVKAVGPLTPAQQSWIYRPGGWTIKQVVHHCADSHMNAFIRFKLSLTEDRPTIKPYDEGAWAQGMDHATPVIHSIKIIEGLHYRWVALLKNMHIEHFERTYFHPDNKMEWSLYLATAQYAWHCEHHLAHIKQAVQYQGKFDDLDVMLH